VYDPPASEEITARALRDCSPDWSSVRAPLRCRVLESNALEAIEEFLQAQVP
jgi:hypothetical protein